MWHRFHLGAPFIQPIIIITKNNKASKLVRTSANEFWPRFWPKYFFNSPWQHQNINFALLFYRTLNLHCMSMPRSMHNIYTYIFFVIVTPSIEYSDYCAVYKSFSGEVIFNHILYYVIKNVECTDTCVEYWVTNSVMKILAFWWNTTSHHNIDKKLCFKSNLPIIDSILEILRLWLIISRIRWRSKF